MKSEKGVTNKIIYLLTLILIWFIRKSVLCPPEQCTNVRIKASDGRGSANKLE